jgi:hypothetical protein
MKSTFTCITLSLACLSGFAATDEYTLTIKNHRFEPKEIKLPANQKVKLKVVNEDPTPAEFESKPLGREKMIAGKSSVVINLGPLKSGRYPFVEEFHETEAGAQGTIVVE